MSDTTTNAKTAFKYHKDDQDIVTITMDMPDRAVNVINDEFGAALKSSVEKLVQEDHVKGVIFTSAKKTFIAGGDIDYLFAGTDAAKIFSDTQELKAGMRALETCGVPMVAAINGAALGGGLEMALACHHRIALNHRSTRFGFPEVTLGIIPGGGGITRTVRLLGMEAAQPLLMEGKQIHAGKALKLGLIHELAENHDNLMKQARAWILSGPEPVQPWDAKGYRMPGGRPSHPRNAVRIPAMTAVISKKTYNNYPAVNAILSCIIEGAATDFETASRIESRYFAEVVSGQTSKNMMKAFWYQRNEIMKGKSRPKEIPPQKTTCIGILGAGLMGHGIAYESAKAGIQVVLKDIDKEKAEKGKSHIAAITSKMISRGRMDEAKQKAILDRILTTSEDADLKDCDLVIEAVFEDRDLKARVTKEAETHLKANTIFASNTSTLPITGLAKVSNRPHQFIGIHFFSPVHKMNLVEIIVGKQTNDLALAKAFDYVLSIRKTPIVVNDSRGFYTSRVFSTYTSEGMALLAEGQNPNAIEMAARLSGMPMGPLEVLDSVNLKTALSIGKQAIKDLQDAGKEMPSNSSHRVLPILVEEHNRWGKLQGAGFYDYNEANRKTNLWSELTKIFLQSPPLELKEIKDRLMFIQAIETVRCLQDQVLTSIADANLGSILGWGFAPFKGGTIQFINDYGVKEFAARAKELAGIYGDRFTPPELLLQKAEKGEKF